MQYKVHRFQYRIHHFYSHRPIPMRLITVVQRYSWTYRCPEGKIGPGRLYFKNVIFSTKSIILIQNPSI